MANINDTFMRSKMNELRTQSKSDFQKSVQKANDSIDPTDINKHMQDAQQNFIWNQYIKQKQQENLHDCTLCNSKCKSKLRCSICKISYYCSIKCQRSNWKIHKLTCNK
jgi:hypothetical protein